MNEFYNREQVRAEKNASKVIEENMRAWLPHIYAEKGLKAEYLTLESLGLTDTPENRRTLIRKEMSGYDVKLTDGEHSIIVDEKAFASSSNAYSAKETFSFEVATYKNSSMHGWLFNNSNINSHYALIYTDTNTKDFSQPEKCEILIIDKHKITDYLLNVLHIQNEQEAINYIDERLNNLAYDEKYRFEETGRVRLPVNRVVSAFRTQTGQVDSYNFLFKRSWLRANSDYVIDAYDAKSIVEKAANPEVNDKLKSSEESADTISIDKVGHMALQLNKSVEERVASFNKKSRALKGTISVDTVLPVDAPAQLDALGETIKLQVESYAKSGKSLAFKAHAVMPNALNIEENAPFYIICNAGHTNINCNALNFQKLEPAQQFSLNGTVSFYGTLSQECYRTAESVDNYLHELDEMCKFNSER